MEKFKKAEVPDTPSKQKPQFRSPHRIHMGLVYLPTWMVDSSYPVLAGSRHVR